MSKKLINSYNLAKQALFCGDFSQYLFHAQALGFALQISFKEKIPYPSHEQAFRDYIITQVPFDIEAATNPTLTQPELYQRAWHLYFFLLAWEEAVPGAETITPLKKHNESIEIIYREAIRAALFATLYGLLSSLADMPKLTEEEKQLIEEEKQLIDEGLNKLNHLEKKANLTPILWSLLEQLEHTKHFSSDPNSKVNLFRKATKAITAFKPLPEKSFYVVGMVIATISALACGITVGGCIFLVLFSQLYVSLFIAVPVSLILLVASTRSNYRLFTSHIPSFLMTLIKSGGITEIYDKAGNPTQLSAFKKSLLLLATLFSAAVGMAESAITILAGPKLLITVLALFGIVSPPALPIIVFSVLAGALLMGLTILMFMAFVEVIKTLSCEKITDSLRATLKKLTDPTTLLYYVLGVTLIAFGLFGLFFLCMTGIPALIPCLGISGAYIVGWMAFAGNLPFVILTLNAFVSRLPSLPDRMMQFFCYSGFSVKTLMSSIALILNAIGNGLTVLADLVLNPKKIIASVATALNSLAGNMPADSHTADALREKATAEQIKHVKTSGNASKLATSESTTCQFFSQAANLISTTSPAVKPTRACCR